MDVARADGNVEKWSFECSSPNMMIRWGWNADDIQRGDKITVDAHPAVNGQHIASAQLCSWRPEKYSPILWASKRE